MKKSLSILLSFILLTSHSYLTIGTHYCGGEAVKSKILMGETQLGCDMMEMEKVCEIPENHNNETNLDKEPCCQNEYQTIHLSSEFVKDATRIAFNYDFALSIIYTRLNLDLFPKSTKQFFAEYHSPSFDKDIQVLFQTFLI